MTFPPRISEIKKFYFYFVFFYKCDPSRGFHTFCFDWVCFFARKFSVVLSNRIYFPTHRTFFSANTSNRSKRHTGFKLTQKKNCYFVLERIEFM